MQPSASQRLSRPIEWLLVFILVAAVGLLSRQYARSGGVSSVWLANGVMLGYLLAAARERRAALLVACVLGQLAGGMVAGDGPLAAVVVALLNTGEVFIATLPLRALITNARELSRPLLFLRFLGYAVLMAPVLSGALFAGYLLVMSQFTWQTLLGWCAGHALGMATVAPVTLALCGNGLTRLFQRGHLLELLLGVTLIVVTTTAVFWVDKYPLLFLIYPPVMLAALRSGFAGTAFALILVVVIAAVLTTLGYGPLVRIAHEGSGVNPYNILQLFIGVLLLTCFPVAVTMSALRRNQSTESKLRNRLRLLAEHSSDAIVLMDLDGRLLYVSPSIRDVLGQEPEEFLRGTFLDLAGPEHAETLQQRLAQMISKEGSRATITFPGRRMDGTRRWVEARVKHFRDADFMLLDTDPGQQVALNRGRSGEEGFIVTLRDITRRHRAEQELESVNRKLASMALKDGLTGLANRRRFDHVLADGWEKCRLATAPLSVSMVDVDHFKGYNDQYGHQDGDQCLAVVARTISACLRRELDSAARYGGEEFALVLPGTGADAAAEIAERIRASVQRLELPHTGSDVTVVTVSVGVSTCVPDAESRPEDLVSAADRALYISKAEGRNRVAVAPYNAAGQG